MIKAVQQIMIVQNQQMIMKTTNLLISVFSHFIAVVKHLDLVKKVEEKKDCLWLEFRSKDFYLLKNHIRTLKDSINDNKGVLNVFKNRDQENVWDVKATCEIAVKWIK
jgi:hypothetical protein